MGMWWDSCRLSEMVETSCMFAAWDTPGPSPFTTGVTQSHMPCRYRVLGIQKSACWLSLWAPSPVSLSENTQQIPSSRSISWWYFTPLSLHRSGCKRKVLPVLKTRHWTCLPAPQTEVFRSHFVLREWTLCLLSNVHLLLTKKQLLISPLSPSAPKSMWLEGKSLYWRCVNARLGKCLRILEISDISCLGKITAMSNISALLISESKTWQNVEVNR